MSNKFVDEVRSGPRLYDILTEDGNTTLYSKVQINKNYIPLVEGSKFGAKDANRIDNVNSLQSLEIVDMRLDMTLFKLGYVGFYDMFDTLDDVDGTKTNADVNTTNQDVTFNVGTYDITASADYTAVSTIRTNEEPSVGDRIDDTNEILAITTIGSQIEYDRTTPVQVVGSALSLNGNGSRKIVRLVNELLYILLHDGTGFKIFESANHGTTWTEKWQNTTYTGSIASLATDGVKLYVLQASSLANDIRTWNFNPSTYPSGSLNSAMVKIEDQTDVLNDSSIVVDGNGHIHVVYLSKNAPFPTSDNMRYSKSIDEGETWETPTQLTPYNNATQNHVKVSIAINNLGYPTIVSSYTSSTTKIIYVTRYDGASWTSSHNGSGEIVTSSTNTETDPCIDVSKGGTVVVVWRSGSLASGFGIYLSYSLDNGVTWSTPLEIWGSVATQTGFKPIVTIDKNGLAYIVFYGEDTATQTWYGIYYKTYDIGLDDLSARLVINESTTTNDLNPSVVSNFRDFTNPMVVFQDGDNSDIKFSGKWTEGSIVYELDLQSNITVVEDEVLEVYPSAYPYETLTMKEQSFIIQAESVLTKLYLKSGTSADFEVYINDVLATLIEDDGLELTYESISVDSPDIVLKVNGKDSAVLDNALFAVA